MFEEYAGADLLPRITLCDVQRLGELGKVVGDLDLLQPAAIRCQPLVEWDGVPLNVLPVGNARRNFPVLVNER